MAKAGRIELTEAELMDLRAVVQSTKAERRMVERAKVILCWHEGKTFARTEAETGDGGSYGCGSKRQAAEV